MMKILSFFVSATMLIFAQSFATNVEPTPTAELPQVTDLSQITKDQLKGVKALTQFKGTLQEIILKNTRKLAYLQHYEDMVGKKDAIYFDLKKLLVQTSSLTLAHINDLLHLYSSLEGEKISKTVTYAIKTHNDIQVNLSLLYQSIKPLVDLNRMISESTPVDFDAFQNNLQKIQNKIAGRLGNSKLSNIASTVFMKANTEDGGPAPLKFGPEYPISQLQERLNRRRFTSEISAAFGSLFFPIKALSEEINDTLERYNQSILKGEPVNDEELAALDSRAINLKSMHRQLLVAGSHLGEMLTSLYYITPYDEKVLVFPGQREHIDSYFDNLKRYLEHSRQFMISIDSEPSLGDQMTNASDESFFVTIDSKANQNPQNKAFIPWLKNWEFDFNYRGIYGLRFQDIDTEEATMFFLYESIIDGNVYHNEIFEFPVFSSDNISRPPTAEELLFFKAMKSITNPRGTLLITDPIDSKKIWTIRGTDQYLSVRFDRMGQQSIPSDRMYFVRIFSTDSPQVAH